MKQAEMFNLEEITTSPAPMSKAELYAQISKGGPIEPAFSMSDKARRARAREQWLASIPETPICPHDEPIELVYCEDCEGPYQSRY